MCVIDLSLFAAVSSPSLSSVVLFVAIHPAIRGSTSSKRLASGCFPGAPKNTRFLVPATDSEHEVEGLECFTNSLSIRVQYYRLFEYSLKWKTPMSPRRSSRLSEVSKKSPQGSPSSDEEVIQRRLKGKRQRAGLKKTKEGNSVVTDEGRDIIDIINSTHDAKRVTEDDGGKFVLVSEGMDESDDDRHSVASSLASGPSLLRNASPKKPRPSQGLCSACKTLQQRAKKMKAPIKNKLLDTDPKSLTCDQWVLIKTRKPRRLPNVKGKLLIHVQLVKKRLKVKNGTNRLAQCVGERESSACWRPHPFLQRNLKRVRVLVKKAQKKTRRKRTRTGSQSTRVAKQQRRHSNNRISDSSADMSGAHPTSGHYSSPGHSSDSSEPDINLSVELIPSLVTLETSEPRGTPPEQKAPKRRGGFRDLLVQLRGSSTIVRETR
ncbi:uncharacterized protein LOC117271877 isoform X4 [Epinephelus lanceolatus]|uniref:uncharacterized protein si:ch211-227n13.3 isoform X1 n=2 Tax=Epinephelus lanceolatus TaxID=310571 RepID=UPI001444AC2E|nr:uncharacterized protein si:ch211-227n13.3 isoform X1 [Epinephelus lanceolatus]